MMNSVKVIRESDGYLNFDFDYTYNDEWFNELMGYLEEGEPWSNFIDPRLNWTEGYGGGNFYCTKNQGPDVFVTDEYTLEIYGSTAVVPVVVKANSLYGLLITMNCMKQKKVPEFTIINEGPRYTFTAPNMEPVIIDPDLGILYNETVPYVIVRRRNDSFTWDVHNYNTMEDKGIRSVPIKASLELLCTLVVKDYNPNLLETVSRWVKDGEKTRGKQRIIHNSVSIVNNRYSVRIEPAFIKDRRIHFEKINIISSVEQDLTKPSFLTFLQAWESRLKYCDAFTLVFLGDTLRFFEGEPLPMP